jgi:glutaredoxin
MEKPFRIMVFGKTSCDKCKALNRRLDRLMTEPRWQDFEKVYCDVETEEGLVAFCRAEGLNPQQVPAMIVTRREGENGPYVPVPPPSEESRDPAAARSMLWHCLGLQTDYSDLGRGVISPRTIEAVLRAARETAT